MSTFLGMPVYAPRGVGQLRAEEPFPAAARKALADTQLRRNIGHATQTIRDKRAAGRGRGARLGGSCGSPASRSRPRRWPASTSTSSGSSAR